jgi:hypothetical protein
MQPQSLDAKSSVDTYSEEWRRECEAKHVLRIRTLHERREYLEKVLKARGEKATNQLKADMMKFHKEKR